jgi:predicted nucleotidyltransferase
MEKVIKVLDDMVKNGVIKDYAIGGSVAVMVYTELFLTKDTDIFIYPQLTPSGLVHLSLIHEYLSSKGYKMRGQYYIIEGMTVDFVPVYNRLVEEAMENLISVKYSGNIKMNVFRAEYLIAIAIQTGRPQDKEKVRKLTNFSNTKIDDKLLKEIIKRHNL